MWYFPGNTDYATTAGEKLAAGDFIFLAYQLNDLTGLPIKRLNNGVYDPCTGTQDDANGYWESTEAYDANIEGLEEKKYAGIEDARGFTKEQAAGVYKWYNFEYDAAAYCYAAGNRSVGNYLKQPNAAPMILQLAD